MVPGTADTMDPFHHGKETQQRFLYLYVDMVKHAELAVHRGIGIHGPVRLQP